MTYGSIALLTVAPTKWRIGRLIVSLFSPSNPRPYHPSLVLVERSEVQMDSTLPPTLARTPHPFTLDLVIDW